MGRPRLVAGDAGGGRDVAAEHFLGAGPFP
jgi:hypothetical protein